MMDDDRAKDVETEVAPELFVFDVEDLKGAWNFLDTAKASWWLVAKSIWYSINIILTYDDDDIAKVLKQKWMLNFLHLMSKISMESEVS